MRRTTLALAVSMALVCGSAVAAVTPWSTASPKSPAPGPHQGNLPSRDGGETIDTAVEIPALPFSDAANTCPHIDDYDEVCPYTGSTSPDVVYRYSPSVPCHIDLDLCASIYDTKVYIYDFDGGFGFDNPWACNDDFGCGYSGYQSRIMTALEGGHTYYFVIDGYGGDCGDYDLQIDTFEVEIVECPEGGIEEGEEECHDDYLDEYNGGCGSEPPVFFHLEPTPGGAPFDICGKSGTFLFSGLEYRDTDWYQLDVTEASTVDFICTAEFPVVILIIDGRGGCQGMTILASDEAGPVPDSASLSYDFEPGTYWFWVGPSVFSGVPCDADYVVHISGFGGEEPSPVETGSWGSIKSRFREGGR